MPIGAASAIIPKSGFALKPELERLDAVRRFGLDREAARKRAGEMPPGCDCARVVLGKIYPDQCVLFGKACTPRNPIGPCMVSDEGACRIWWASGKRQARDEHAIRALLKRRPAFPRAASSSAGGCRASASGPSSIASRRRSA